MVKDSRCGTYDTCSSPPKSFEVKSYTMQKGTMDRVYGETTFCSQFCTICNEPIQKTIILKSGSELKLCKKHLEDVEDEFAKKIIERHIPYQPYTIPNTPCYPTTPYPTGPIWLWQPNTTCGGRNFC